jgi:hypothetical protein
MRALLCFLCACAILACSPIDMPAPRSGHPADPDAPAAPQRDVAASLEVDPDTLPRTPPELRQPHTPGGHSDARE